MDKKLIQHFLRTGGPSELSLTDHLEKFLSASQVPLTGPLLGFQQVPRVPGEPLGTLSSRYREEPVYGRALG